MAKLAKNLFGVIARRTIILRCPETHDVVLILATFLLADAHEVEDRVRIMICMLFRLDYPP